MLMRPSPFNKKIEVYIPTVSDNLSVNVVVDGSIMNPGLCDNGGSERSLSYCIKASSEDASETSEVEESGLKEKWDAIENKSMVVIYEGGAVIGVWLASTVVDAINGVPMDSDALDGSSIDVFSLRSFFLDVIKSLSLEYEHVAMNLTLLERGRFIIRTSLTGFPAQSVRSSNAGASDSLYLLVSLYRTPQSRLPH
ncbi:curvature thylakoid 1A, chloroplastic-like protein [Tanacetum coccineum]